MNCVNFAFICWQLWMTMIKLHEATDELCQFTFTVRQLWMTMIKLHETMDELCQFAFTFRQPWMTKVKLSWSYGWTVSSCFHFQAAMNDKGQAFMKLWMNCVNFAFTFRQPWMTKVKLSWSYGWTVSILLSLSGRFEWHFSNLTFGKLNHAILAFRKLMDKPCQFSFWETLSI